MMLNRFLKKKNMLISHSKKKVGSLLSYCWQAIQAGNGGFGHSCPCYLNLWINITDKNNRRGN